MERFSINIRKKYRKQNKGIPSRSENVSPVASLETATQATLETKPEKSVANIEINISDMKNVTRKRGEYWNNHTYYQTLQKTVTELKPTLKSGESFLEEPINMSNEDSPI